jgi:hypothetical protein
MTFVTIALSAVAILVSVWGLVVSKRINETNLQSEYFREIFSEYFIEEIPKMHKCIYFEGERLSSDYKQFTMLLVEMLNKAMYFKFANESFYLKLSKEISDFDDRMINCAAKTYSTKGRRKVIRDIDKRIKKIIKLVNKYYKSS